MRKIRYDIRDVDDANFNMRAEDRIKIYANYKTIVDNVDFDEIKDYLLSNLDDFEIEDVERINHEKTKSAKARLLLKILMKKKSPDVLMHFCNSLKSSEVRAYETLANAIEATDPTQFRFDNVDASFEDKIGRLREQFIKQTQILEDKNQQLEGIPAFRQLSRDGRFVVNENIEEFSKYKSIGVNLRVTKEKKIPSSIRDIACQLGEDALSTYSDQSRNKHILAMRKLVMDISQKNKDDLSSLIQNMHILEMVGFPTVEAIARELYSECNWGRVVVWFAFWRELADYLEGRPQECKLFGSFVGFYLGSTCEKWINENGGWVSENNFQINIVRCFF